jgi:hypothetical protein
MEKRVKIIIMFVAFFADLWVWNFRANNLTNQIFFVVTFLVAPLIWYIAMDIRYETGRLPNSNISKLTSIKRMIPQLIVLVLSFFIIISEVLSRLAFGCRWGNTIQMVILVCFIGFLWNLVIRDLHIGD